MKKSIVTLVAAATLFSAVAPVFANNNLGTTHVDAQKRNADYQAAVTALNNQKTVVSNAEAALKTANANLTSAQNAAAAARAIVVAYRNALTAEEQEAVRNLYGVSFDDAIKDDETTQATVAETQKAVDEAVALLNREQGKVKALEDEVARTKALVDAVAQTPEADDKDDNKGDKPAENTKSDDKDDNGSTNKQGHQNVKAAPTATGTKALPKTSAAK